MGVRYPTTHPEWEAYVLNHTIKEGAAHFGVKLNNFRVYITKRKCPYLRDAKPHGGATDPMYWEAIQPEKVEKYPEFVASILRFRARMKELGKKT